MAIYFAGYLSPFRNKLGNAVGRKWRTLDVLAVYNGRPRNPRTTAQQIVRARFASAASVARSFAKAVAIGFKSLCDGTPVPERSMFIKKNFENFQAVTPNAVTVEFAELKIAEGTLPEAQFGSPVFTDPLSVKVTMTDTSSLDGALATDKVYLFVYSPEAGAGVLSQNRVRTDVDIEVAVPSYWNGHRVHVWGFAQGAANTENEGLVSNSRYLGHGDIQ